MVLDNGQTVTQRSALHCTFYGRQKKTHPQMVSAGAFLIMREVIARYFTRYFLPSWM